MKKTVVGLMMTVVLAAVNGVTGAEAGADAVKPGQWTMDLDAAKKMANEKKIPILLDFSGSDWCGWCKLMEKSVFAEQKWKDYAKDNLMMVMIDFPQDTSLVPEKYVKRNAELKIKYAVQGYPAFIFLDDDGETVLGQLGASEGQTPEGFIKSLQGFFRYRPAEVAKFTKAFSPADKKAYLKIISQMKDSGQLIEQQKKKIEVARKEIIEVAQKEIMELEKKRVTLQEAAMDFRVSKLEPAKQAVYKELKEKMAGAQKKFEDWIATRPERNEENNQKFKVMNSELQDLAGKLSEF